MTVLVGGYIMFNYALGFSDEPLMTVLHMIHHFSLHKIYVPVLQNVKFSCITNVRQAKHTGSSMYGVYIDRKLLVLCPFCKIGK